MMPEELAETLEVMADDELMAYLRQGIAEMETGMFVPWEDAKRELGI
ncbi:MAG: hypothetical protein P4L44_08140 [Oryzomonas sp.]|nr:hypothetical protein [Oryzomonas sp.]MDR3579914.1 hypothetical protein [Oryzomonas sp.]